MRHPRPARLQQFRDWVNNAPVWQSAVAALLLAVATLTGTVAVLRAGFSVQPGPGSSRPLFSPEPTSPARPRLTPPPPPRLNPPTRPRLTSPTADHPARLADLLGECPDLPGASCD